MRILLSGGGTAGHVLPHIAVVKELQKKAPQTKFLYVGSKNGPEKTYAKKWGIPFKSVPVGKLRRYFSLANALDAIKVPLGVLRASLIMIRFRPDVVFSKGGYVSVPVILAARILKKPIVIHDSDAKPGLTTKIAKKFAKKILLGYPEAAQHFPKEKVVITGIPIREEIFKGGIKEGLDKTGFSASKPVILVMGGSLGAQHLNKVIEKALPELLTFTQVIHITGRGKKIHHVPGNAKGYIGKYKAFEYVDAELPHLYRISDFIIGRAGANSIAEIQALKKPSLLVPLGAPVSHGDQIANARVLEERGGCIIVPDSEFNSNKLIKVLKPLLSDKSALKRMSRKAYHPFNPKAAEKIAKILLAEAKKK
ncbi:undecaprenyldiphospho-muramoylpentapeptide beta-N-acetylglucosaminyltransferase [Candidatus Peregrinibacteria bacterium]|nr:undecaprenyldiphospho-muramoylpentapeptide beta-N-acetylglucosaminyltransferase [Candidatus Peregrinibacteria bacterium]MBT7483785.1 undecaprenyldiphospho-muramoylpentapeptide beta-N-acetylglucosaminyltransferase [Candidatus Peregrinibacteria bacterium]MBT7703025.1 undecaprenyldiphospho-muramoylpentapeptide beta-N-acetylglucosaminyltransferase [Candidatus Peregrinibacteria bacterium]